MYTRRNRCLPTFHSTSTISSPSDRATRSAALRIFSKSTQRLPDRSRSAVHSNRRQQKSGLVAHSSCDPLQSEIRVYSRRTVKARYRRLGKRSFDSPRMAFPVSLPPICPTDSYYLSHTFHCYFTCYVWGLQRTLAYLPARTSDMRILTPFGKRRTCERLHSYHCLLSCRIRARLDNSAPGPPNNFEEF